MLKVIILRIGRLWLLLSVRFHRARLLYWPSYETLSQTAFMNSTPKSDVTIYTDGGCRPNPGIGGWAAVLIGGGREREISGGQRESTNNRMELTAAVEALAALKRPCSVTFYTDSEYLRNGITKWLKAWKRNNWVRREGPVKNVDLWKRLDELAQTHEIDWRWVRAHAGNAYNERCDELAAEAIERIRAGLA